MSVKSVPKKGYKSVPWLFGKEIEIPEEWEVGILKSLCNSFTKQTGFDYTTHIKPKLVQTFKKGTIPFIQNKDFEGKKINYNTDYFIPENIANIFTKILLNEKCLLITISGNIGNIGIFSNHQNAFVGGAIAVAKFKNKNLLNYIMYYLLSPLGQRNFIRLTKTASHQNLILDDLRKMKILFPPLPEQQQIASILSNVDNLIQNTDKLIEKTTRLKKGLMQKLLTRGIGHTKFKKVPWLFQKEIEIPEEWEVKKLENLTDKIGDGIHSTPRYVEHSEYYFINGNNLINGKITYSENTKNVSKEEFIKYELKLNENTILLSINGTIGNVAFYNNEKIVLGKSASYIICNNDLNSIFFFYLLQSNFIKKYFTTQLTGTTISNLSLGSIRNMKLHKPPLHEQQKIASILSNTDEKIQSYKRYKEKLQNLKTSLMQKLLTGDVRVAV